SMYLVHFGAYHLAAPAEFTNRWIWLGENRPFRQTEYFKLFLEALGAPSYWRERGFPPACRPISDDDFECE
ncbi:MAG: hypothetical protein HKN15_14170, partial [Xanthomonadales bacterium]|nr:hypothetical protein [Xanthomonadales bacterium]